MDNVGKIRCHAPDYNKQNTARSIMKTSRASQSLAPTTKSTILLELNSARPVIFTDINRRSYIPDKSSLARHFFWGGGARAPLPGPCQKATNENKSADFAHYDTRIGCHGNVPWAIGKRGSDR